MQRSRRKHYNPINAPALARWIVITGFLAITGLIYVYLSVQLYRLGDRRKALENEFANVSAQNKMTNALISDLTSRSALEQRIREGYLRMTEIRERDIVRVNVRPRTPTEDAIQPVVNQQSGR